ncbi:MAG: CBS domain-containing protein [Deltaproteobacteria bacterium]|nr:CBS domain-containing protein [Deltaproteobacteria bacterium]MBW2360561.1 CBS domain-containing protein [Deltaproteobacteria bacterium]
MSGSDERVVADVMATDLATLETGEKLDLAEDIMHVGRIRHMPVVEGKRLVGIVSVRDLLAASLSQAMDFEPTQRRTFLRSVSADEVMTRDPLTVMPDTSLATAAELMCEQKIGCVPVVDRDTNLLGLVTETDLVRAAYLERSDGPSSASPDTARRSIRPVSARFRDDLDVLRRARDELRVQIHLGKADAQDLWHELEHKWEELERRATTLREEAREPLQEVRDVAEDLAEELRRGYRRLKSALSH